MKGNISRQSFREDRRYSAVLQVQGGMVTDADLGEEAIIARQRSDNLGRDALGNGVPETGGIVDLAGAPKLVAGAVYAEGVRGVVEATGALDGPLALYSSQAGFPHPPALPASGEFFLYADIWERTVTALEDPLLADAGFHGVETSFREQTLAQIKFAPLDQLASLGDPAGPLPRIGGGVLTAEAVDAETIADECDPCADTVSAEQTVANGLFRIEVLQVRGDPQSPDSIVLGWSAENAAAVAPAGVNPEDFGRAGAVYETFATATEMHLGVHHDEGAVARSSFIETIGDTPGDQPAAPDGQPWPFLRRWDGIARIPFGGGSIERLGTGTVTRSDSKVALTAGVLSAQLDFGGKAIVAGDYWLVETRRFSADPVRVVSQTPLGIAHHYCPLLRVTDGALQPLTDAETRRLSFPTLADIAATHVGFTNACDNGRFAGAENVQEALDTLCDIKAADISFDSSPCRHLYDSVDNVQDALINLCKVDFGLERYLRLMHDWGIVCGVIPRRRNSKVVAWSGGAILDRRGRLGDVEAAEVDVSSILRTDRFHFDKLDIFERELRRGKVCLALSIGDGGKIEAHLAPRDRAFGEPDPTFLSVFNACRTKKTIYDFKDDLAVLDESKRKVFEKVLYGASSDKIAGSLRMTAAEGKVARRYNESLISRYKAHVEDEKAIADLDRKVAEIEAKIQPENAAGAVQENLRLQREALIYGAVRETEQERIQRCLCDALMVRCPEPGAAPFLVPICCLRGTLDGDHVAIEEVCPQCCRKQAMSWRWLQYFVGPIRDGIGLGLAERCCPGHDKEGGDGGRQIDPHVRVPPIKMGRVFEPFIDPLWDPPKTFTDFERILGRVGGWEAPDDFRIQPEIADLGIDVAKVALEGNGIKVARSLEVDDPDVIVKLREARVRADPDDLVVDRRGLKPGDEVALVVRDGIVLDYVKLDTGANKYLFERQAGLDPETLAADVGRKAEDLLAGLDRDLGERENTVAGLRESLTEALDKRRAETAEIERQFDERLEAQIEELNKAGIEFADKAQAHSEELAAAAETLATLAENRATLVAQLGAANSDIARLREEREAVTRDIAAANTELGKVRAERESLLGAIADSRAELESVAKLHRDTLLEFAGERDRMVEALRKEIPVTAVTADESRFSTVLANSGVISIGGLAALDDTRLKALASEAGLNLNTARRFKREAERRLTGPIG